MPVKIPAKVTQKAYAYQRQIYESLPQSSPQRAKFRRVLLTYLTRQAKEVAATAPKQSAKLFTSALTLHSPPEVYKGVVPEPALLELSRETVKDFAPRGDESKVVPALCVQMSAFGENDPRRKALEKKVAAILIWLEDTARLTFGHKVSGIRALRAMEAAAEVWPSRFVLETLRSLYIERSVALAREMPPDRMARAMSGQPAHRLLQVGYNISRLYLRVNRSDEALQHLRAISTHSPAEELLQRLLEQLLSPSANVEDHIRLAEYMEDRDPSVALGVCQAATAVFPREARVHACVGRLAAALRRVRIAHNAYREAVELAPHQPRYAEALAEQMQRQLFQLIAKERLTEAERLLRQVETFYASAQRRFGKPLQPSLSDAYYAVGVGLYNAGKIPLAKSVLQRALKAKKTPQAVLQLALISVKTRDGRAALAQLADADALPAKTAAERDYWRARTTEIRGRAFALLGDSVRSKNTLRESVQMWQQWLRRGLRPPAKAEASVRMAKALFALSDPVAAVDALEQAIDADPTRKETYADAIALLTTYGHLPEALDAYHRALGREEVGEYLKTYCTFWVVGLARRAAKQPDPLALSFLKRVKSKVWYGHLAKLVLGKMTFAQVARRASKVGQRAELYFYWADRLVADGKPEEAREMWRRVVDTKMLAFFEYDMAMHYLHEGPTPVHRRAVQRRTHAGAGPTQ